MKDYSNASRETNLDTLRILSIVWIIVFHYVYHGRAGLNDESGLVRFSSELLYHFGELGVNCFFLISGYFFDVTRFSLKKVFLIIVQVEFYVIISKLLLLCFDQPVQWNILDFLPFLKVDGYWFVSVYLLIYVLHPCLKTILNSIDEKKLRTVIIIQVVIWCIIPTFVYSTIIPGGNTESMPLYNRYIWFVVVYLIGGYIRQYGLPIPEEDIFHYKDFSQIVRLLFPFELLIVAIILGERGLWPFTATYFWTPNTVLMLLMSVTVFDAFLHLNISWGSRIIYYMASSTLGIYLFHDGELRNLLWNKLFLYKGNLGVFNYLFQIITATLIVFTLGILIDKCRSYGEKILIVPIIDKLKF